MVALYKSKPPSEMPAIGELTHSEITRGKARRAWSLFDSGNYVESLKDYEGLREFFPKNPNLLALIGVNLFRLGRFASAIESLEQARTLAPDDADILNMLGAALGSEGRLEEALGAITRARILKPSDPDIVYNLALALDGLGDPKGAVQAIDDWLRQETYATSPDLLNIRRNILDAQLRRLAKRGVISWGGGKPKGPRKRIELGGGPSMSEWIIQSRR